jgi:hypothetical protein
VNPVHKAKIFEQDSQDFKGLKGFDSHDLLQIPE